MTRILFVCHGNICRSPMAEFILKALTKARGLEDQYYIESAAVSMEEIGNPIYPPAKRCLTQHGVPFDKGKCARQVTRADYARFDRIICMDSSNLRWIRRIIPEDPQGEDPPDDVLCGEGPRRGRSVVHGRLRNHLPGHSGGLRGHARLIRPEPFISAE